MVTVGVVNVLGGTCPGGKCPCGNVRVVTVRVVNVRVVNVMDGKYPDTIRVSSGRRRRENDISKKME